MKKTLFLTIILLLSYTSIHASTEGRMFLEVKKDFENESTGKVLLDKIYNRGIKEENIQEAVLHTYIPSQESSFLNITEVLKKSIANLNEDILFEIDKEVCFENCPTNKYPYIKTYYSFNNPPSVYPLFPSNNMVLEKNEVTFVWHGEDSDGKLLEFSIELSKSKDFENNIFFQTHWLTKPIHNLELENGKYYWRVRARDHSKFNHRVYSEIYSFDVNAKVVEEKIVGLRQPIILVPQNNWLTNLKGVSLVAEVTPNAENTVYVNNKRVFSTKKGRIEDRIEFTIEGVNNIKVMSRKNGEVKSSEVNITTDWTPPASPKFELKVEDGNLYIKIDNNDYSNAFLYLDEDFLEKAKKTNKWRKIISNIKKDTEYNIGVFLEDKVGNRSKKVYQMYTPHAEVLGHGSGTEGIEKIVIPEIGYCRYKYNETYGKFQGRKCKLYPPKLISVTNSTKDNVIYNTEAFGVYNERIKLIVDLYECSSKTFCRERYLTTFGKEATGYSMMMLHVNERWESLNKFKTAKGRVFETLISSRENFENQSLRANFYLNMSVRFRDSHDVIEITSPKSKAVTIPKAVKINPDKKEELFRFPFNRHIGVTQWHGHTAYQSPHTGVDFGAYKEPIYALGNGHIRSIGWDNYYGKCLSGGNILRIEHDNGFHSVYMHLENYLGNNGKNWKIGDRIRKGQLLGMSGNTGAYNCQPLGYHLHLEIRKNKYQSTHVNPVPYIDVNWDSIPTLQHQKYPGRLTGSNPHPTW